MHKVSASGLVCLMKKTTTISTFLKTAKNIDVNKLVVLSFALENILQFFDRELIKFFTF